jgi:hypothetical protein
MRAWEAKKPGFSEEAGLFVMCWLNYVLAELWHWLNSYEFRYGLSCRSWRRRP